MKKSIVSFIYVTSVLFIGSSNVFAGSTAIKDSITYKKKIEVKGIIPVDSDGTNINAVAFTINIGLGETVSNPCDKILYSSLGITTGITCAATFTLRKSPTEGEYVLTRTVKSKPYTHYPKDGSGGQAYNQPGTESIKTSNFVIHDDEL